MRVAKAADIAELGCRLVQFHIHRKATHSRVCKPQTNSESQKSVNVNAKVCI
jgi:hypothetical protein